MIKTLNPLARQLAMSLALGLAACFSFNNPAEDVGDVFGHLVDEKDVPAEGASCVFSGTSWDVTTDRNGAFNFVDVPEGSYELFCTGTELTGSYRENVQVKRKRTLDLGKVTLGCAGVQYCCGLPSLLGPPSVPFKASCVRNQWNCFDPRGFPKGNLGLCCQAGVVTTATICSPENVIQCPEESTPGACGGGTGGGSSAGGDGGLVGYVEVSLMVDDTANKVYANEDLAWKGSMRYDSNTRIAVYDAAWTGPFPKLYDDGPWTAGGHEGQNAVPRDHKFGAVVFIAPPASNWDLFQYDVTDLSYGDATIRYPYEPLAFIIPAGLKTGQAAPDVIVRAFGSTDLKLVLDKAALAPRFGGDWNLSKVQLRSSAAAWKEIELKDDGTLGDEVAGDGRYTFVLSQYVGKGLLLPHNGLLNTGDAPEFVFVLGGDNYKDLLGVAIKDGVTAFTKTTGTFLPVTVSVGSPNTYVTIP